MWGIPYLAVNMDQVHQLFRLIAVPCHFALFVAQGQLEDRDTDEPEHNYWIFSLDFIYSTGNIWQKG